MGIIALPVAKLRRVAMLMFAHRPWIFIFEEGVWSAPVKGRETYDPIYKMDDLWSVLRHDRLREYGQLLVCSNGADASSRAGFGLRTSAEPKRCARAKLCQ